MMVPRVATKLIHYFIKMEEVAGCKSLLADDRRQIECESGIKGL